MTYIKCMDKNFPITDFPFTRSGFLYKMHGARAKFQDSNNKIIDYRQFHYRIEFKANIIHSENQYNTDLNLFQNLPRTVRIFFDIAHFISVDTMQFHIAIELAVFVGHEGQIEMDSKLEIGILSRLVQYVKESNLTPLEHALAFIYLKSWGPNAKYGFYSIRPRTKFLAKICSIHKTHLSIL